jgi:tetrahydromethanopterin S-methyltransferase subunit G
MKSISIVFVLFVVLSMIYIIPAVYAEEDDDDDDREGFGEMKREREREHQDEGIPIGTDIGNVILYGTIAAIIASIVYTAFKITSSKRKSSPKS